MSANTIHIACSSVFEVEYNSLRLTAKEFSRHCHYDATSGILGACFGKVYCRKTSTVQLHPGHQQGFNQQGLPIGLDLILRILGFLLLGTCRKLAAEDDVSRLRAQAASKALSKISVEMARDHRENLRTTVNSSINEARKAALPKIKRSCDKITTLASTFTSGILGEQVQFTNVDVSPVSFVDFYAVRCPRGPRGPRGPRVNPIRVVEVTPQQDTQYAHAQYAQYAAQQVAQPNTLCLMPPPQSATMPPPQSATMPPPQSATMPPPESPEITMPPPPSSAHLNQQHLETMMMLPPIPKRPTIQLQSSVEEIETEAPTVGCGCPAAVSSATSSNVRADLDQLAINLSVPPTP